MKFPKIKIPQNHPSHELDHCRPGRSIETHGDLGIPPLLGNRHIERQRSFLFALATLPLIVVMTAFAADLIHHRAPVRQRSGEPNAECRKLPVADETSFLVGKRGWKHIVT